MVENNHIAERLNDLRDLAESRQSDRLVDRVPVGGFEFPGLHWANEVSLSNPDDNGWYVMPFRTYDSEGRHSTPAVTIRFNPNTDEFEATSESEFISSDELEEKRSDELRQLVADTLDRLARS